MFDKLNQGLRQSDQKMCVPFCYKLIQLIDIYDMKNLLFVLKKLVQGVPIKMRLSFCSISLAILIQQDLDYILLKTDIHSFVLNTKTFMSDIWKPRYICPKFKYQN